METKQPNPRRAELKALSAKLRPLVKCGKFPSINAAVLAYYGRQVGGAVEWHTFQDWRKAGRPVNKGERGFPIWGQPKARGAEQSAESQPEESSESESGPSWFPVCYLFHAGQVAALEPAESVAA